MLAALAATLAALPACPATPQPTVVAEGLGSLEAVIVDTRGRLFFSATAHDSLMVIDAPGAQPRVVADGIPKPGGLALEPDGDIVIGQGDGFQEGALGNLFGLATLVRVDPDTGEKETIATGLQMANGVVRDSAGVFYASNDVGTTIDRVENGAAQRGFAEVVSANGLAIDAAERYLYAAQTFQPAAIKRVDLADPSQVTDHFVAPPESIAAGPDGMTIDERDRLFVTANAAGEVWRVDPDGSSCVIARGITTASAVALGQGATGFRHENLYTVGFDGVIREIAGVRPVPAPLAQEQKLRLRVRPRRVEAGERVRFRLRSRTEAGAPVSGATIRFAGRELRTGPRGHARTRVRLRAGRHVARLGNARAVVRARKR